MTDVRMRDRAIASTLPMMPRRLVRRLSSPYIAGESQADAMATVGSLAQRGFGTTLDVLGEAIRHTDEARATRDEYLEVLDQLAALTEGATGADADVRNVSVKLTAIGLGLDDDLCWDLLRSIVERAATQSAFVRIDMEDAPFTDRTLAMHERLRSEGFDNVGVVIQAYLKRSADDIAKLAASGARVRLVKGIYIESPTIAIKDPEAIRTSFVELARTLVDAGCHTAFATHDAKLVDACEQVVTELAPAEGTTEFQMLLGVTESLRDEVQARGHHVRVYVPYGARWYEYSLRRLRENPRVAGYVAEDIIRSMRRRVIGR